MATEFHLRQAHIFCDAYDGTKQSDFLAPSLRSQLSGKIVDDHNARCYAGRLRLDALLNKRVVLRDADIADGRFFLHLAQTTFAKKGGLEDLPWPRIEIQSASKTVEDYIVKGIAGPAKRDPQKPGFVLSALDPDEAFRFARESGPFLEKASGLKDIFRTLDDILPDSPRVELLKSGIHGLISAESRGLFQFTPRLPCDDWEELLRQRLLPSMAGLEEGLSPHGRQQFQRIKADIGGQWGRRSPVYALLDEHFASHDLMQDTNTVKTWYNWHYNGLASENHGCRIAEIVAEPHSAPLQPLDRMFDKIHESLRRGKLNGKEKAACVNIPPPFLFALERYPVEDFDRLLNTYRARLDEWYTGYDPKDLNKPVDRLIEEVDETVGLREEGRVHPEILSPVRLIGQGFRVAGGVGGGVIGYLVTHHSPEMGVVAGSAALAFGKEAASTALEIIGEDNVGYAGDALANLGGRKRRIRRAIIRRAREISNKR